MNLIKKYFDRDRIQTEFELFVPRERFEACLRKHTLTDKDFKNWNPNSGIYLEFLQDGFNIRIVPQSNMVAFLKAFFSNIKIYDFTGNYVDHHSIKLIYRLRLPYFLISRLIYAIILIVFAIVLLSQTVMFVGYNLGLTLQPVEALDLLLAYALGCTLVLPILFLKFENRLNQTHRETVLNLVRNCASKNMS